jgi:hypothetical protein
VPNQLVLHARIVLLANEGKNNKQIAQALAITVDTVRLLDLDCETKQLMGLESCQCRKARIVRNHIACAILVWVRLKQIVRETGKTVYMVKHGLLSDYMRQQLRSPTVIMVLA